MPSTASIVERAEKMYAEKQSAKRMANYQPPANLPLAEFGSKYFSHFLTTASSIFHKELIADLDGIQANRGSRICRIAPRGSAKSTWSTLINPIKRALHGEEHYIIIISDIQPNANKFLKAIKDEIETNEALRNAYGEACRPGSVWREEAIELPNGCRIEALGKGGKIRGRRNRQHRPTLIILDDPQSFDDSFSITQMEKDFAWLMADVMNAGGPDTNYLVLGTALADICIVCQLGKTPEWNHKVYSSLISPPKNMHLWNEWENLLSRHDDPDRDKNAEKWYLQHEPEMCEGAQVLWPERLPLVDLMRRRYSGGERAFQSEHQGVPMPPGDAEFDIKYFEYDDTFWFDEWPEDITIRVMGCDPSKGIDTKQGDYQAITRWAEDRNEVVYVEAFLEKMDTQVWCDYLVKLQCEWPAHAIGLEVNGFQQLLEFPLAESCKAKSIHMRLPIVPLDNRINKAVRILDLTNLIVTKKVRFKRNSRGTALLIDQLKKFRIRPMPGQHDDGADSMSMAQTTALRYKAGR